jgi:hypothetical protein
MLYYFLISQKFTVQKKAFFDATKVLLFFIVRKGLEKFFFNSVYFSNQE